MMRSLWISKTGMEAQQTQLDTSRTTSPTSARTATSVARGVRGPDVPEPAPGRRQQQRADAAADRPAGRPRHARRRHRAQLHQGNLQQTSNTLDVAINGNGFFQIQLPDGTTGYTRDGSFQVRRAGPARHQQRLHRAARHHRSRTNAQSVTIGNDGTVSGDVPGQALPQSVGTAPARQLRQSGRPRAEGREHLFAETAASGTPRNAGTPGRTASARCSKASSRPRTSTSSRSSCSMIQTQRAYEINSKAIQTSDQMLQKLAQL
jgi:flagellar basal-body rod protein FlgG